MLQSKWKGTISYTECKVCGKSLTVEYIKDNTEENAVWDTDGPYCHACWNIQIGVNNGGLV